MLATWPELGTLCSLSVPEFWKQVKKAWSLNFLKYPLDQCHFFMFVLDPLPLRPVPEEYEQAVAHLTVTEKDIESIWILCQFSPIDSVSFAFRCGGGQANSSSSPGLSFKSQNAGCESIQSEVDTYPFIDNSRLIEGQVLVQMRAVPLTNLGRTSATCATCATYATCATLLYSRSKLRTVDGHPRMSDLNAENRLDIAGMSLNVIDSNSMLWHAYQNKTGQPLGTAVATSMALRASAKCEWWGLESKT